jgi:neopullulanase
MKLSIPHRANPLKLALVALFVTAVSFAQSAKPVITKIDPPDWFAGLPASLLLVHGEHFENTTFVACAKSGAKSGTSPARITETTISSNGHWAFVGFEPGRQPGKINLVATNPRGSTTAEYTLALLRSSAEQPKGFTPADVVYLIMPDRFADGDTSNDVLPGYHDPDDRSRAQAYHGGDLRGIAQHLDYLQALGVTTIWTTPLYDNSAEQSGQSYHGYSATDMFAVDPHLGTMEDLRALVRAAHERGMKVVLDTVPNHVGAAHPWAKDPPSPSWLHGSPASHIEAQFDFTSIVNPSGNAAARNAVLNGWFANSLPDLNQDDPLVALYLIQNGIWWIERSGADGLRLDTFPFVPRTFWHAYNGTLHELYPHLSEVGEVFSPDANVTSFYAGGRANRGSDGTVDTLLDTPFDYPMFFALRGALTGRKPMSAIADVLREDALYPHPERLVTFLGNHDNKRFLSEPGADAGALRLGFGLLATLRGMPQLYYGDEIAMKGGDDPDNRRDFPGGFAKDKADAFEKSARNDEQESMEEWVHALFALRAKTPALETGQIRVLSSDANTLAILRGTDLSGNCAANPAAARYVVVANASHAPQDVTIRLDGSPLAGCAKFTPERPLATGLGVAPEASQGSLRIHLAAQEIAILRAGQ